MVVLIHYFLMLEVFFFFSTDVTIVSPSEHCEFGSEYNKVIQ